MMRDDWHHQIGDRVSRPVNVYDDHSVKRYGVVIEQYSRPDYEELYAVRWDSGEAERGFLWWGLIPSTVVREP